MNDKDFVRAEKFLQNLYIQGDTSLFVEKHLGICFFQNKEYLQSISHLQRAIQLDSSDYEISFTLARSYYFTTGREKGLPYFELTYKLLMPDSGMMTIFYDEKAYLYSALNQHRKSIECYKSAYAYSQKPEYLFYIASAYESKLKNREKAIDYYKKFLDQLPEKQYFTNQQASESVEVSLRHLAEDHLSHLKEEQFMKGVE